MNQFFSLVTRRTFLGESAGLCAFFGSGVVTAAAPNRLDPGSVPWRLYDQVPQDPRTARIWTFDPMFTLRPHADGRNSEWQSPDPPYSRGPQIQLYVSQYSKTVRAQMRSHIHAAARVFADFTLWFTDDPAKLPALITARVSLAGRATCPNNDGVDAQEINVTVDHTISKSAEELFPLVRFCAVTWTGYGQDCNDFRQRQLQPRNLTKLQIEAEERRIK